MERERRERREQREYREKEKAIVWENKPKEKGFRKPNVVKKKIRMHDKPNKYLEITVEPTRHETIYDDIFDIFECHLIKKKILL